MSRRLKAFDTEIFSTSFVFQDIYDQADKRFKSYVDSLSDTDLLEFIDKNLHRWRKGFESGIMNGWDEVASTVASDTNLPL